MAKQGLQLNAALRGHAPTQEGIEPDPEAQAEPLRVDAGASEIGERPAQQVHPASPAHFYEQPSPGVDSGQLVGASAGGRRKSAENEKLRERSRAGGVGDDLVGSENGDAVAQLEGGSVGKGDIALTPSEPHRRSPVINAGCHVAPPGG
jgi:hypothetical protein